MLYLRSWEYQLLILALPGGLGLVFLVTLLYLAIWRSRRQELAVRDELGRQMPLRAWASTFMPWFVLVTVFGSAAYVIAYTLWNAAYPPNW